MAKTVNGHNVHLMQRVLEAMDMLPLEAAEAMGVSMSDIMDMWTGSRGKLADVDRDIVWQALSELVNRRIGALLSVREELQRKLDLDRTARARERIRTLTR